MGDKETKKRGEGRQKTKERRKGGCWGWSAVLILQQRRKRREDSATNCARTDRTREALAERKNTAAARSRIFVKQYFCRRRGSGSHKKKRLARHPVQGKAKRGGSGQV